VTSSLPSVSRERSSALAGSKTKAPKGGWKRSDWPQAGEGKVVRGFCQLHHSFWCPCANPGLYGPRTHKRVADPNLVVLPEATLQRAIREGKQRQANRTADGSRNRGTDRGADIHVLGRIGEHVVAHWLGIELPPDGSKKDKWDLEWRGIKIGVRTRSEPWHDLYVWPDDLPDAYYVLVYAKNPETRVLGGIWGRDAQTEDRWAPKWSRGKFPHTDCYIVPSSELSLEKPCPA
jgi:hypothetical protein